MTSKPTMPLPIKLPHILAIGLTAGVAYYMYGGTIILSGTGPAAPGEDVRATDTVNDGSVLFAVRARDFEAQDRPNALVVRGRTMADASIAVTAETGGRVVEVAVREGQQVAAGDVLCRLDEAARRASLAQARAALEQSEVELAAARSLAQSGFGAQNRVAGLQAAYDGAQAMLEQQELDLARTIITAPVDGLVQLPLAETGAQLAQGALCATLLDTDPLVITGQVSERSIASIAVGMGAQATLVTGENVEGTVAFISAAADDQTRTFRVDIDVPNPDNLLRAGITSEASIALPATRGHLLPLSALGLDDAGILGIHTLNEENIVAFKPITILGDQVDGVWVSGLEERERVIVIGQDYVQPGQEVAVTMVENGILQTSQATPLADASQQGAAQ